MQVFHQIACSYCGNIATRFCPVCENLYTCNDHDQIHCGNSTLALITTITEEELDKKISQINTLKNFLNSSKKKNIEETEKHIAKVLEISNTFQAELDTEIIKIENLEHCLNLTMNFYQFYYPDWDFLFISKQNPIKIIQDQWVKKNLSLITELIKRIMKKKLKLIN